MFSSSKCYFAFFLMDAAASAADELIAGVGAVLYLHAICNNILMFPVMASYLVSVKYTYNLGHFIDQNFVGSEAILPRARPLLISWNLTSRF